MKIYVTGHTGRIGRRLTELGCLPLIPVGVDISNYNNVHRAFHDLDPGDSLVLHLASIADVDRCEKERDKALMVNYRGTRNLAAVCHEKRIGMAFLSTDHIYNGKKGPYREDYNYTAPNLLGQYQAPVNYYGLTKMTAELVSHVYPFKIIRTSYNFDRTRMDDSILRGESYPTFLFRSFMYVDHLVSSLKLYMDRFFEMPKVLNLSGSQTVSWYDFMLAYSSFGWIGKDKIVPHTKEDKNPDHAPRPHKAGLVTKLSAKLGFPQYSYLDGLKKMWADAYD